MQTKKYFVTNNSEGSICITGRQRIDIPGLCKDLPLVLPENTARQTISRLKQRYPLLKIRSADEDKGSTPPPGSGPEKSDSAGNAENNPPAANTADSGKDDANSIKNLEDAGSSETAGDKNTPPASATQTPATTQKADARKGK